MADPLLLHGPAHGPDIRYEAVGGWLMPHSFSSPQQEYTALRRTAGLIDLSLLAWIEAGGPDRIEWLQRLLTNDLASLAPGTGCQAALLAPNAWLIAQLLVLADEDRLWLLCDAHRAAEVAEALERYHFGEEVQAVNHERAQCVVACQGPLAVDLVGRMLGHTFTTLRPEHHRLVRLQQLDLRLVRHAAAGDDGLLCCVPASDGPALWRLLKERGRAERVEPVGWEALNTVRIEAGVPWPGVELDDTHLLSETGLERSLVSDSKGCYVGQEVVARMATYGSPSQRLMGLLIEGDQVPLGGARLTRGGEDAGWVTSACISPALGRAVALAYVKRGAYEPGSRVEVAVPGGCVPATVSARPLVAPAEPVSRPGTG
jgi:folate-binding protein YgfZ